MTPKFCMQCGAKLTEGNKFCMQCGAACVLPTPTAPVQETAPAERYDAPVQEAAPLPPEPVMPPQEPAAPAPQMYAAPVQEAVPVQEVTPVSPQPASVSLQKPAAPPAPQEEEAPPVAADIHAADDAEMSAEETADDAAALFHAGRDHLLGDHGASVDHEKAVACLTKAYAKGCDAAARWLAAAHILAAVELVRSAPPASDDRAEAARQED